MLTNIRVLGVFACLYILLLASFYFFVSTREATLGQVLLTYFLLVFVPALFFLFQATIIDHARENSFHWRQIVRDAVKLFLVTIPILLIGWGLWALLNKWQLRHPAPLPPITFGPVPPKPQPMHWPTTLFATLRLLLFGVALPLVTIHLWIEVTAQHVRELFSGGAKTFLKRIGDALARAFSADSVFTYALGVVLFVFLPYAILFVPFTPKGTKTDFVFFVLRLVLAFASILIGWFATVAALTKAKPEPAPAVKTETLPDAPAEAPA